MSLEQQNQFMLSCENTMLSCSA